MKNYLFRKRLTQDSLQEILLDQLGLTKSSCEVLKGFDIEGPLEEVLAALTAKGLPYKRKHLTERVLQVDAFTNRIANHYRTAHFHDLKRFMMERNPYPQVFSELRAVVGAAEALGVASPMVVSPLMAADPSLYSGFMCQFLLAVRKRHTTVQVLEGREDA